MKHYLIFFITGLILFFSANLAVVIAVVTPSSSFDYLSLYKDGQEITDVSFILLETGSIDVDCGRPLNYNKYWVCQGYRVIEIRKYPDSSFVTQIELPTPRDNKVREDVLGIDRYFDVDIETGKVTEDKSRYYFEKIKKDKISILGFSAIILGGLLLIRKRRLKNL